MVDSPDKKTLNDQQKAAVEFGEGPLLVIAGAGTGKTTVITERIKYLIASGRALPHEILALTFTEKASREMEARVDESMPYGVTQMWISTFHAFCDRLLRNEAINIGLDPGFKLMTEAETIQFFRKHLFAFDLKYFRPYGNPNKFISGMLQHFSRLKDDDVSPEEYMKWIQEKSQILNPNDQLTRKNSKSQIPKSEQSAKDKKHNTKSKVEGSESDEEEKEKYLELAKAYRTYEELKVREGLMDYADLISNTLKVFRSRKAVLRKYQDLFKYVLIDEFQDTNYAQNEMAILLTGQRSNITVVGDDDQAIYRWRGAAVSNIIQFRSRYPTAAIIVLTKNYRSTKEILDRSYDFIQHNNPDRLEVTENIDKKLESMRRIKGKPIHVVYMDRVENEAGEVAKEIQNAKFKMQNDKGQPYDWKDFAILVRANNHAEPFIRALGRAGVPYQFLGPGQLFRQPEVKDLIAYLKVLYNPEDNISLYRVLTMDWLGIHPRDTALIFGVARRLGRSVFEICERTSGLGIAKEEIPSMPLPLVSEETKTALGRFISMVYKHLALVKHETAGQILYYFLEESGLLKALASFKTVHEEKRAANIAKLFDKLKTYEADHDDASVFTVVDWIDLSMTLGESPLAADTDWNQSDAVNILTIHSAKGLEFPVVFLVNLVSARFPTNERKEQIPIPLGMVKEILPEGDYHLEEERRLFYVGMTRARDRLFLTAAQYYGEGKREKKLSPFIAESVGTEHIPQAPHTGSGGSSQLSLLEWDKPPEASDTHPVRQPVHFLSYSQADAFRNCPLLYKYRYVVRIPVPPSAALSFGDTVHKTIRSFYELVKNGESPAPDRLISLYHSHWSSVGFGNKQYEQKMKAHGEELLREFYDKGYRDGTIPRDMEYPFKIRLTPALTVGGKIDRIDQKENGAVEIIDYKTGTAPKGKDVSKDLQLSVYALAAVEDREHPVSADQVTVSFYFLEGLEKISSTRTTQQLAATKDELIAVADEISRSEFLPKPGKHCDFCEFRLICEAWN